MGPRRMPAGGVPCGRLRSLNRLPRGGGTQLGDMRLDGEHWDVCPASRCCAAGRRARAHDGAVAPSLRARSARVPGRRSLGALTRRGPRPRRPRRRGTPCAGACPRPRGCARGVGRGAGGAGAQPALSRSAGPSHPAGASSGLEVLRERARRGTGWHAPQSRGATRQPRRQGGRPGSHRGGGFRGPDCSPVTLLTVGTAPALLASPAPGTTPCLRCRDCVVPIARRCAPAAVWPLPVRAVLFSESGRGGARSASRRALSQLQSPFHRTRARIQRKLCDRRPRNRWRQASRRSHEARPPFAPLPCARRDALVQAAALSGIMRGPQVQLSHSDRRAACKFAAGPAGVRDAAAFRAHAPRVAKPTLPAATARATWQGAGGVSDTSF